MDGQHGTPSPSPARYLLAAGSDHHPGAVELAVPPEAPVGPPVGPREGALAVLHVPLVGTLVGRAVRPVHPPVAAEAAGPPLAGVLVAVGELVGPVAVHPVVPELPRVREAQPGRVCATAVLAAALVVALVPGPVGVALGALAAFAVRSPLAVERDPVRVDEGPVAVPLAVVPLAVVYVAAGGPVAALAVRLAVGEVTLVALAVCLREDPVSVARLPPPLARVRHAPPQVHRLVLLPRARLLHVHGVHDLLLERVPDEDPGEGGAVRAVVRAACRLRAAQGPGHDRHHAVAPCGRAALPRMPLPRWGRGCHGCCVGMPCMPGETLSPRVAGGVERGRTSGLAAVRGGHAGGSQNGSLGVTEAP
mmetsp:Transcript_14519/g.41429  ORF Transcript_14519/g.41429 Transcript_14519/m.41429 type:complete len:363 (-) Transcript_14519:2-1090(-)